MRDGLQIGAGGIGELWLLANLRGQRAHPGERRLQVVRHAAQKVALDRCHPIQLFRLRPQLLDEQGVLHGDRGVLAQQAQQLALRTRWRGTSLPGREQARSQVVAGGDLDSDEGAPWTFAVAHRGDRFVVGFHGRGPGRDVVHRRGVVGA